MRLTFDPAAWTPVAASRALGHKPACPGRYILLAALSLLLFPAAARGATPADIEAGLRYTAGPGGYSGLRLFAGWSGEEYYLSPALNTVKSDSSDRLTTYSLAGGVYRGEWDAGGEVSVLPESGGYGNTGLYADLTWNPLEKRPAPGMDVLALGVFTGITFHEDVYSSSSTVSGGPRGGAVKARTSPLRLSQYDYGVYASAGARGLLASARLTLTSYGEDIAADSRSLPLEIGSFETSGFPDRAWSLRLRCPALPLSPEAAYSRNYYLLDRPSSGSWRLGVSWPASFAELSAGWESFDPGGGAGKERYYSFGLSRSF